MSPGLTAMSLLRQSLPSECRTCQAARLTIHRFDDHVRLKSKEVPSGLAVRPKQAIQKVLHEAAELFVAHWQRYRLGTPVPGA